MKGISCLYFKWFSFYVIIKYKNSVFCCSVFPTLFAFILLFILSSSIAG